MDKEKVRQLLEAVATGALEPFAATGVPSVAADSRLIESLPAAAAISPVRFQPTTSAAPRMRMGIQRRSMLTSLPPRSSA